LLAHGEAVGAGAFDAQIRAGIDRLAELFEACFSLETARGTTRAGAH